VVRQEIAQAKREELRQLASLKKERDRVEDRLRRIALRRAQQNRISTSATAPSDAGGFFSYPVANTYITSPYGMRFHPILHVLKLHDGTDFHAPCGVPVYAAAAGTVMSPNDPAR